MGGHEGVSLIGVGHNVQLPGFGSQYDVFGLKRINFAFEKVTYWLGLSRRTKVILWWLI